MDKKAAEIVQCIYQMYLDGYGVEQIASQLEREQVLTPTAHSQKYGQKRTKKVSVNGVYAWASSVVAKILRTQEYCGDVINFKTYTKSFKNKKRLENALENQMIFEDVHEPIIDRETFRRVQERYGQVRTRPTKKSEKSMFSGLLICSTCGGNLNFHFNQQNHEITYFNCAVYNKRGKQRGQCDSTHYIRTDFLEQVVLGDIKRITAFAKHYELEFLNVLTASRGDHVERKIADTQHQIVVLEERNKELDALFARIYEDSVGGKISEERFVKMATLYEVEQAENEKQLVLLERELLEVKGESDTAQSFVATVKRYTRIKKLTPEVLRQFVDKIIVHHRERIDGMDEQKIEIFYNCVGVVEVPDLKNIPQTEIHIPTRKGVALSYSLMQQVSSF